ncbi:MAG: 50S ribosomal protein L5 [Deltaproteobacteria bacterium CG11_big_fil_rev_8_21_14_0_20_49_13]|nr:MAG: 50S ribosomal protein L5 [Deltaproteobacteria bacterium CG11_big_fil_rev_8_21_14_0_20_49_13]
MNKTHIEQKFLNECVPFLQKEFGYKNPFEMPKLKMIVVNTSLKEALQDSKVLDAAVADMAAITGQKPVITRAKKSISNFKLRAGQAIGARVTLRRKRMFEFLNRLVNVALPRVRDFKGVDAKSFDGRGNYTLGLTEQIIFPEINPDKTQKVFGMNVTFVTTAKTDKEGKALLKFMGMPFNK